MDRKVQGFDGYELIDSGGGRKLERFGEVLLDRPSPQAIWPANPDEPWSEAGAVFKRGEGGTGDWQRRAAKLPEGWKARLGELSFEIRLTGFGNVGLFPEHTSHWSWMGERIHSSDRAEVLNLFAYTGGASISCAKAGAQVTHVDAAKSVNGWAMVNAGLSNAPKNTIRYLADDALKFVNRELRRERRYDGIIIDPPTFGRGPKGEVWKNERDLHTLCERCQSLLSPDPLFVLLTSHSPGVTPSVLGTLLARPGGDIETGEMLLDGGGPFLPAGAFARWTAAGR